MLLDPSYMVKIWNREPPKQLVTNDMQVKQREQHVIQSSTYCVQGRLKQCFT